MEGPKSLEIVLSGLNDTDLDITPSTGGWTIREIVHHIVDGDDIWKMGIKQALGNVQTEFSLDWYRTLTQDTWADCWSYSQRSIEESLTLLKANRDHIMQLLEHVPDAWEKTVEFYEPNGKIEIIPVGFIIEMQADHVFHHIKQIEKILQ